MRYIALVSKFTGRWFAVIVLLAGAVALAFPGAFVGWGVAIPWMLAVIMFGMGLTLHPGDFLVVAKRPWASLLGIAAQYIVMPLLAFGIALALQLPPELIAGMVLVGAAPGGTASNVMVYLSRGDTAISVAMTTVSTLLAPLVTPMLVLLLAGQYLPVDAGGLFVSIVQIVIVPIVLGLVLRTAVPRLVDKCLEALPLISVMGITAVVMAVVAGSQETLLSVGALLMLGVVLHNILGLSLGYGIARLCRLDFSGRRAVSIEVGMQNSGLSASLAAVHFNPAAALPAAIFSVWHNVSGSLLASYWARKPTEAQADSESPVTESAQGT